METIQDFLIKCGSVLLCIILIVMISCSLNFILGKIHPNSNTKKNIQNIETQLEEKIISLKKKPNITDKQLIEFVEKVDNEQKKITNIYSDEKNNYYKGNISLNLINENTNYKIFNLIFNKDCRFDKQNSSKIFIIKTKKGNI